MSSPHGTLSRYVHDRCRCDECRAANTAYKLNHRRTRGTKDAPHGTVNGYVNWSCRCDRCVDAHERDREERATRRYFERLGLDLDDVLTSVNVSPVSDMDPPERVTRE